MNITIVQGPYYPVPPLLGGAIEKAWFDLGREFARAGHRVVHVSRRFGGLPAREVIDGVEHVRIAGFSAPSSKMLYRLLDFVYSVCALSVLPAAQIIVTNAIWLPILIRDSRYGALYVHVGRYPKGQMSLYAHAARLQTVSSAVACAIARQSPSCSSKVRVIPYPLNRRTDPLQLKSSWSRREKTILYVGRIHPEKGLQILLEGFARFIRSATSQWRLAIVGPWEPNAGGGGRRYYQRLRACAEPLNGRADWVGPLFDRRRLDDFYRRASLFCYPSVAETGESFGVAPLEAMSLGCPVLVSALSCFQDYIIDGQTGFVFDHRSNDPAASLAQKLSDITSSTSHLSNIATRACRTASRYTLPAVAAEFLADFSSLIGKQ